MDPIGLLNTSRPLDAGRTTCSAATGEREEGVTVWHTHGPYSELLTALGAPSATVRRNASAASAAIAAAVSKDPARGMVTCRGLRQGPRRLIYLPSSHRKGRDGVYECTTVARKCVGKRTHSSTENKSDFGKKESRSFSVLYSIFFLFTKWSKI